MSRSGYPIAALTGLALALLASSLSSAAHAVEIETAVGAVTVAAPPKRIAVFDIAAIDTLDRLGVDIVGLPENLFAPQLAGLKDKAEIVGSLFEPDLEALSALQPDLIIVGGRSSPAIAAVGRVAQSIDMTIGGTDLIADAKARIAAYGALFGKVDEAEAATAELDAAIAAARTASAGKGKALIVMASGPKISVFGEGSRFGWLHSELGLPSAIDSAEAAIHGDAVSFEFIRKVDPDWLIVLDRAAAIGSGEANARATLDNELVAGTTAWRKGQVIYLPAADFYIAAGGARATVRVIDAIADAYARAQ